MLPNLQSVQLASARCKDACRICVIQVVQEGLASDIFATRARAWRLLGAGILESRLWAPLESESGHVKNLDMK